MRQSRSIITVALIVVCVFLISQCINKSNNEPIIITNKNGEQFAGSATCTNCHKNIYDKHIHTAHYLTSQPALEKYIKGSFEPGNNFYAYNGSVQIVMEKRDSGFYQVEYYRETEQKAHRFDIVIGSGTMGQSYLYWQDSYLYQLPITYFTAAKAWSNSPGFPDRIIFNRIITSRCLECHATYVNKTSPPDEQHETFDRDKIIWCGL
jgi:small nuclear ribonucleoprotein (snRNP)-like protein